MAKNSKERRAAERAAMMERRRALEAQGLPPQDAAALAAMPSGQGSLVKGAAPVAAPVVVAVPAPPPPPEPKKKEPRKRYVRPPKDKAEIRTPAGPALPQRKSNPFGMLLTKNLAVPPLEDSFGRPIDAK